MRFKVLVISIIMIIIVASIIPIARADTEIILNDDDLLLEPVVFGNKTTADNYMPEEYIVGFSVTDDGRMFTVSHNPLSRFVHGQTEVSLIAWGSDGAVLWSHITNHWDRKYYDVTHDGSFVYVVGRYESDILIEKYSFEGDLVWNTTISGIDLGRNLGDTEKGYEILVMGDGTIIIGGVSWNESPNSRNYLLLALDQTGYLQWAWTFLRYPSPQCDSDYLYVKMAYDTLWKMNSSGDLSWSHKDLSSAERPGCANEDVVYTISSTQCNEYYEEFSISNFFMIWSHTEISITSWNSDTGEKSSSSNLRLCDADHQLYNCSWVDTEVDQDGLIWILMKAVELDSWYLMSYNQMTESTSFFKVFKDQWYWAHFEMDSSGNAYIAATSESYGYIVMKFDSSQLSSSETSTSTSTSTTEPPTLPVGFFEMVDLQLVGTVFVGVVIFDAVLIVYFKRKAAG